MIYLKFLMKELFKLSTEGTVVPIDDANGPPGSSTTKDVKHKAIILYTVGDLRGVPHVNFQAQVPALRGACNLCVTTGIKHGGTTIYPGAVRYLSMDDPLRATYRNKMPMPLKEYADQLPPNLQTMETIRNCYLAQNGMYKQMDPFNVLPHWDTSRQHLNDIAHLTTNLTKIVWGLMLGAGSYRYDLERHKTEIESKRFKELSIFKEVENEEKVKTKMLVGVKRPPWSLDNADRKRISDCLDDTGFFGQKINNLVKRMASLKFSDWFFMGSAYGVFLLTETKSLTTSYKELFIACTHIMRNALSRTHSDASLDEIQQETHKVLTRWELLLPSFTFTIGTAHLSSVFVGKHHFQHLFSLMKVIGPARCTWMYLFSI